MYMCKMYACEKCLILLNNSVSFCFILLAAFFSHLIVEASSSSLHYALNCFMKKDNQIPNES